MPAPQRAARQCQSSRWCSPARACAPMHASSADRCAPWEIFAARQWLRGQAPREWPTRPRPEAPDLACVTSIQACMDSDLLCPVCGSQYTPVWCGSMTQRLTAQDWIEFSLRTLAREGYEALKADVLARKLGVSRGSFYWHFSDLGTFHARVIDHWRQTATAAIIAEIERRETPAERLDALLRLALGQNAALEIRMRSWADGNAGAARAVEGIDRRRCRYMEQLLVDAGVSPGLAQTRAQLLYWSYLGSALSRNRLTGKRLERTSAELKQIGLRGSPGRPSV